MKRSALLLSALFLNPSIASADDWPQFRGPNRDGISRENGLLKTWPKDGPRLVWSFDQAGLGYSGPAIVQDRMYFSSGRGDSEYLVAFDIKSGQTPKELWSAKIGPLFQWKGNQWNTGPNATPTIGAGRVFALGGFGDLICVDATSGKEFWRKNLPRDFAGEVNPIGGGLQEPTPLGWGYASAPLLDGDRLICVPGGTKGLIAALNAATGDLIWQSKDVTDQASYSSPIAAEIGGVRQYVQATNTGIVGIAARDGKRLWSYVRNPAYDDVVIATPIVHDGYIFASVGFAQGCDLIRLAPHGGDFKVETVFSNKSIENRDGGVVMIDGHIYGHSENKGWFCQEFTTGKNKWSEKRKLGRGSIMFVDGLLVCCAEEGGEIVVIEATPNGWNEKGRFKLPKESSQRQPSGRLWTHPVVANGRLYIRDQELLYCFDLRPSP